MIVSLRSTSRLSHSTSFSRRSTSSGWTAALPLVLSVYAYFRLEKSDEELEETIRRETPEFFPLFTTFRNFLASKEGQGLAQWLAVLLAAVLLVIELHDSDSTEGVTPE